MDIQNLMVSDKFSGYKAGTQKTAKVHLKSYLTIHRRQDLLLPSNYHFWKDRKGYSGGSNRYDELKAKAPSQAEVDKVLDICEDIILTSKSEKEIFRHMALWFAAAYGLRCKEIKNLRPCDVQHNEKTLHIEKSKGDKSRDVYMDIPITTEMWERFMAARSSIIDSLKSSVANEVIVAKLDSLSDRRYHILCEGEQQDRYANDLSGHRYVTSSSCLARPRTECKRSFVPTREGIQPVRGRPRPSAQCGPIPRTLQHTANPRLLLYRCRGAKGRLREQQWWTRRGTFPGTISRSRREDRRSGRGTYRRLYSR